MFTCGKSEDFQKTHGHLISCMRQNHDNGHGIASSMEMGEACDFSKEMPRTKTPAAPTEDELKTNPNKAQEHVDEVKSLEMMHKAELQEFVKCKQVHAKAANKACTLLMQQCTEKMERQLKNRDDFSSKLKDNPIELMKATKEETHHFGANACDVAIAAKVAKDMLNMKQGPHESLLDCACRFKNTRDVM